MRIAIVIALLFICACAPATVQGLREKNAGSIQFYADDNYQTVYRTIMAQVRVCHEYKDLYTRRSVQGNLSDDTGIGNIALVYHDIFGDRIFMAVDVKSIEENKSQVNIFYAVTFWKPVASAVEDWVKLKSSNCRKDL